MSKLVAIRIDDALLVEVDRERRRAGQARSRAVHEALALWLERKRLDEAIRRDREGYAKHPVTDDEFGPLLGAQQWPK